MQGRHHANVDGLPVPVPSVTNAGESEAQRRPPQNATRSEEPPRAFLGCGQHDLRPESRLRLFWARTTSYDQRQRSSLSGFVRNIKHEPPFVDEHKPYILRSYGLAQRAGAAPADVNTVIQVETTAIDCRREIIPSISQSVFDGIVFLDSGHGSCWPQPEQRQQQQGIQ
ncbi:hypothetical protein JOM56_007058 [Amanita muscaria]